MPSPLARATAAGRWVPSACSIRWRGTNACTAPERPKPSTSGHRVSQNMKNPSRRLRPTHTTADAARGTAMAVVTGPSRRRVPSRPHEPGDGGRGFGHLLVGRRPARRERVAHAVAEVVAEQLDGDGLQGLGDGRHLRQHINAVAVVLDHPLQAAHLSLDPPEAVEDGGLVARVPGRTRGRRVGALPGVVALGPAHTAAGARWPSTQRSSADAGRAPTWRATSRPRSRTRSVGTPLTAKRLATPGASSTLTFTVLTRPANRRVAPSTAGPTIRHGPHHGAHRSTRTGRALSAAASNVVSSASTSQGRGSWHFAQRGEPAAAVGTRLRLPQPVQATMVPDMCSPAFRPSG